MLTPWIRTLFICLTLGAAGVVFAAESQIEEGAVAKANKNGTINIEEGYLADSNNVQDSHEVYRSGYESGKEDAANRADQDYTQHEDEYDYSTEAAYSRGYEDGFRGFGGAGAMHGGAGSGGGRR